MVRSTAKCAVPYCGQYQTKSVTASQLEDFRAMFRITIRDVRICDHCSCFYDDYSTKRETIKHVRRIIKNIRTQNRNLLHVLKFNNNWLATSEEKREQMRVRRQKMKKKDPDETSFEAVTSSEDDDDEDDGEAVVQAVEDDDSDEDGEAQAVEDDDVEEDGEAQAVEDDDADEDGEAENGQSVNGDNQINEENSDHKKSEEEEDAESEEDLETPANATDKGAGTSGTSEVTLKEASKEADGVKCIEKTRSSSLQGSNSSVLEAMEENSSSAHH
jgi:hypothetical protein